MGEQGHEYEERGEGMVLVLTGVGGLGIHRDHELGTGGSAGGERAL